MLLRFIFAGFFVVFLASCGGGGGDGGTSSIRTVSATVVDGAIRGAQVFLDQNDNGVYDPDTDVVAAVFTDSSGRFTISYSSNLRGVLTAVGGIDETTGGPFRGLIQIDPDHAAGISGSLIASPLSTLAVRLGSSSASTLIDRLTGLDLQQALVINPVQTTNRRLADLSLRLQKLTEVVASALREAAGSTATAAGYFTSASAIVSNELLDQQAAGSVGDAFARISYRDISRQVGVSAIQQQRLSENLSTLNRTMNLASSLLTARQALAAELMTEVLVRNPVTTNTGALALASSIAVSNTSLGVSVNTLHLAALIERSTGSVDVSRAEIDPIPFDSFATTPARLVLRGSDIATVADRTSNAVYVYISPGRGSGALTFCIFAPGNTANPVQLFASTWRRLSASTMLMRRSIGYKLTSLRPRPGAARTISSNLPFGNNGADQLVDVSVRAADDFQRFTGSIPTTVAECERRP